MDSSSDTFIPVVKSGNEGHKRALVISGGGAKGAFAGGICEHLMIDQGKSYDIYIGSSTGSLLLPFLALPDIELARKVYTNVTTKAIFKISPFRFRQVNGVYETRVNHLNSIMMFLKRKSTFGDSSNLRKLIGRSFTKDHHKMLRDSGKKVIVTVANFTTLSKEYKCISDYDYEDWCDWMWASANLVPFMSLVHKDGCDYADGGFGDYLPVHKAIDEGACEVDSIFLSPEVRNVKKPIIHSPYDTITRMLEFLMARIAEDDLEISSLKGKLKPGSKISTYFLDNPLTDNSLYFNKKQMSKWWDDGVQFARNTEPKSLTT